MRGLFIKNTPEKVSLAAYNNMGANFSLNVFDQDTNTYIVQNQSMTEGLEPIVALSTTCTEARTIGQEVIAVTDVTGFVVADRISLAGYIYKITDIDATTNTLTLHMALKTDLVGTEAVDRVANMGIYSAELTLSAIGTFLIQVKDSVFGIQHSDMIKVQDKSIRELISDIQTDVDDIQSSVSNSQGYTMII